MALLFARVAVPDSLVLTGYSAFVCRVVSPVVFGSMNISINISINPNIYINISSSISSGSPRLPC